MIAKDVTADRRVYWTYSIYLKGACSVEDENCNTLGQYLKTPHAVPVHWPHPLNNKVLLFIAGCWLAPAKGYTEVCNQHILGLHTHSPLNTATLSTVPLDHIFIFFAIIPIKTQCAFITIVHDGSYEHPREIASPDSAKVLENDYISAKAGRGGVGTLTSKRSFARKDEDSPGPVHDNPFPLEAHCALSTFILTYFQNYKLAEFTGKVSPRLSRNFPYFRTR